jgi:hypothetical protein
LLCIKLIYRENNSSKNKRHPMDAFFYYQSAVIFDRTFSRARFKLP